MAIFSKFLNENIIKIKHLDPSIYSNKYPVRAISQQRTRSLLTIVNKFRSNLTSLRQHMAAPLKIIKPAGILNGETANQLCQQVSESLGSGNNFVLLDMTDVKSIDYSGLGALIISLKMLRTAGGDLYLCSIAEPVRNLLRLVSMDRLFESPNEVSAIANPQMSDVRG